MCHWTTWIQALFLETRPFNQNADEQQKQRLGAETRAKFDSLQSAEAQRPVLTNFTARYKPVSGFLCRARIGKQNTGAATWPTRRILTSVVATPAFVHGHDGDALLTQTTSSPVAACVRLQPEQLHAQPSRLRPNHLSNYSRGKVSAPPLRQLEQVQPKANFTA